jgi:hypothetical protein
MTGPVLTGPPRVDLHRRGYADRLRGLPVRAESAPYGSCHLQAVSNLLAFSGVAHAPERIGLAFGLTRVGDGVLTGGDRWITLVRNAFGVDLTERHARDAAAAARKEKDALAAGAPVAAMVDSFHLPSPYTGREHLAHCVLLVARDDTTVTVIDPMNQPEQTRHPVGAWVTLRSAACVDRYRMFTCPGSARRRPSTGELLRILRTDITEHRSDDAGELADFIAWAHRTTPLTFDVAGVAAERTYLAALLGQLASRHPHLRDAADAASSLGRRWYLLHSLGLAQPDATGTQRDRLLALLRLTADADTRSAAMLTDTTPNPPDEP